MDAEDTGVDLDAEIELLLRQLLEQAKSEIAANDLAAAERRLTRIVEQGHGSFRQEAEALLAILHTPTTQDGNVRLVEYVQSQIANAQAALNNHDISTSLIALHSAQRASTGLFLLVELAGRSELLGGYVAAQRQLADLEAACTNALRQRIDDLLNLDAGINTLRSELLLPAREHSEVFNSIETAIVARLMDALLAVPGADKSTIPGQRAGAAEVWKKTAHGSSGGVEPEEIADAVIRRLSASPLLAGHLPASESGLIQPLLDELNLLRRYLALRTRLEQLPSAGTPDSLYALVEMKDEIRLLGDNEQTWPTLRDRVDAVRREADDKLVRRLVEDCMAASVAIREARFEEAERMAAYAAVYQDLAEQLIDPAGAQENAFLDVTRNIERLRLIARVAPLLRTLHDHLAHEPVTGFDPGQAADYATAIQTLLDSLRAVSNDPQALAAADDLATRAVEKLSGWIARLASEIDRRLGADLLASGALDALVPWLAQADRVRALRTWGGDGSLSQYEPNFHPLDPVTGLGAGERLVVNVERAVSAGIVAEIRAATQTPALPGASLSQLFVLTERVRRMPHDAGLTSALQLDESQTTRLDNLARSLRQLEVERKPLIQETIDSELSWSQKILAFWDHLLDVCATYSGRTGAASSAAMQADGLGELRTQVAILQEVVGAAQAAAPAGHSAAQLLAETGRLEKRLEVVSLPGFTPQKTAIHQAIQERRQQLLDNVAQDIHRMLTDQAYTKEKYDAGLQAIIAPVRNEPTALHETRQLVVTGAHKVEPEVRGTLKGKAARLRLLTLWQAVADAVGDDASLKPVCDEAIARLTPRRRRWLAWVGGALLALAALVLVISAWALLRPGSVAPSQVKPTVAAPAIIATNSSTPAPSATDTATAMPTTTLTETPTETPAPTVTATATLVACRLFLVADASTVAVMTIPAAALEQARAANAPSFSVEWPGLSLLPVSDACTWQFFEQYPEWNPVGAFVFRLLHAGDNSIVTIGEAAAPFAMSAGVKPQTLKLSGGVPLANLLDNAVAGVDYLVEFSRDQGQSWAPVEGFRVRLQVEGEIGSPTPTPTLTATPNPARTATPTPTRTLTPFSTITASPTRTAALTKTTTPTATRTQIPTRTATPTFTPKAIPTPQPKIPGLIAPFPGTALSTGATVTFQWSPPNLAPNECSELVWWPADGSAADAKGLVDAATTCKESTFTLAVENLPESGSYIWSVRIVQYDDVAAKTNYRAPNPPAEGRRINVNQGGDDSSGDGSGGGGGEGTSPP